MNEFDEYYNANGNFKAWLAERKEKRQEKKAAKNKIKTAEDYAKLGLNPDGTPIENPALKALSAASASSGTQDNTIYYVIGGVTIALILGIIIYKTTKK
jgi:hypothetical protein